MPKTVQGRQKQWQLLEVVGRGDAGEVLSVQSELGLDLGVMKRPVQNVSGGTIVRQAAQIESEGNILKELNGLDYKRGSLLIHTPRFIDESIPGTSGTANLFMVSERVQGISIDSMLKDLQQGKSQFPQVLVLKVLVGLFNLLPKVHEKGILWNDVKMEHIYWNALEGKLSFIDWGNGLRFDPQNPDEAINPDLDYQQLIAEGNLLLEQTTSGLIQDLGWPRDNSKLSDREITQLRFRIEFMESLLNMRSSEFKMYFDKMLHDISDATVLQEAIEVRGSLEKLGVSTDAKQMLEAAAMLASRLVDRGEIDQTKQVTQLIIKNFNGNDGESWRLLDFCLMIPALAKHPDFPQISKAILSQDWDQAMWTTQEINSGADFPFDLTKLIMAMRKLVTIPSSNSNPTPEILTWLNKNAEEPSSLSNDPAIIERLIAYRNALENLSVDWSVLRPAQQLGNQFLQARELLSDPAASFLGFPREQLAGINLLLSLTRDLYRNWETGDLKACLKAVHQLFSLEPGALYLPQIAKQIQEVEEWVKQLTTGSELQQSATQLGSQLASQPLALTQLLGQPDWLSHYRYVAQSIADAQDITTLREIATSEGWPVPWLHYQTTQLDLPLMDAETSNLNSVQLEALQVFHLEIRRGFPTQSALNQIRELLPGFHQGYQLIQQAVESAFSPLSNLPERWPINAFPAKDRVRVAEFYETLELVRAWQVRVQSGQSTQTGQTRPASDWKILIEMWQAETTWFGQILPIMSKIRQRQWSSLELPKGAIEPQLLTKVTTSLFQVAQDWAKVTEQGIFRESAQEFIYLIDQAQFSYFEFWQRLQRNELKPLRWLMETSQPFFSQINQSLLQISRYFHAISRSLQVVNTPEMARTKLAQNSAGDLMFSLAQLEVLLQPPTRKRSIIRDWQKQYNDLLANPDREHILSTVEKIESIHPLLPWFNELVRRDADYFSASDLRKW
ncbi:MAG: serine/threonine-protein kinase [Anaerolineaceae bacterium]